LVVIYFNYTVNHQTPLDNSGSFLVAEA